MAAVLRPVSITRGTSPSGTGDPAHTSVRVMLVDDSLTVRTVFNRMIGQEDGLAVVAQAQTAEMALSILRSTKVDVILLDLEMPGIGGLGALPTILEIADGAQVLVVSSLTEVGAEATLAALSMGAADTMLKPRPGGFNEDYKSALLGKIRALGARRRGDDAAAPAARPASARPAGRKPIHVVGIGASTGGIHALNLFLRELPATFDLPILITQHLPESFIPVFARQVEDAAGRPAVLAEEGTRITRGTIVIAPGHGHLTVRRVGRVAVTGIAQDRATSGCMPSVDPMFATLCDAFDGHVAAVLLSGMGRDGTEGAQKIAAAGGTIFAQSEATCAVWGMPRFVTESGLASAVLPPQELAQKIVTMAGAGGWT